MNSELSSAVQREWKIFPLIYRSRLAMAQPLLNHATCNELQIEQWETQYPECSWAVATGSESQVFALNFNINKDVMRMREFGELDPDLSRTLQVRSPNEIFTFLEWPACGLLTFGQDTLATGVRLLEEGNYVPIPGPGMSVDWHYEYVDREAPALPPSEWLMDLIHLERGEHGGARILTFRPSPDAALRILLSFERRDERWFCDFYESTGIAKVRKTLCYGSSDKVVSLAVRGGAFMKHNNRSRLYEGIQVGRGRILLNLTSDQYTKLIAA
jgi:Bifunctional DNA primase/polymerase, N-terminal